MVAKRNTLCSQCPPAQVAWYPFDGDLNDYGGYAYHATAGNGASASCGFLQLASSRYASLPLGEVAGRDVFIWAGDGEEGESGLLLLRLIMSRTTCHGDAGDDGGARTQAAW
jgi:hypothetical protein